MMRWLVMMTVQAECTAWFEALPESLRDIPTAEALQEIIDLIWARHCRRAAPTWLRP